MSDQNDEQRTRQRQERQYKIDQITAEYADAYRESGDAPNINDYVRRNPEYTRELLEFALYFHTVGFEAEALEESPAPALSSAAQKALERIRAQRAAAATAATAPITGLVKQGAAVGYSAPKLAEAVGLTTELLGKLEARAIAVATIPPTLVRRLAELLRVAPDAVAAYLGATGQGQAGAFYYADQAPDRRQESFADAVRVSALSPELKREWAEIIQKDAGMGA